jgi:nitrogen fixation NifU-like protein
MDQDHPLADHYENPRNLGDLENPDAVAIVHNPACGDMLRLAVRYTDGRIAAARFKGYGCAAAIAAGSVTTELLLGTSLGEAASLTEEDILAVLGPLPPLKVHAAVLARETIASVVAQLREGSSDD